MVSTARVSKSRSAPVGAASLGCRTAVNRASGLDNASLSAFRSPIVLTPVGGRRGESAFVDSNPTEQDTYALAHVAIRCRPRPGTADAPVRLVLVRPRDGPARVDRNALALRCRGADPHHGDEPGGGMAAVAAAAPDRALCDVRIARPAASTCAGPSTTVHPGAGGTAHRLRRRARPVPGAAGRSERLPPQRVAAELVAHLHRAMTGERYRPGADGPGGLIRSPDQRRRGLAGAHLGLTQRESEVLAPLAAGHSAAIPLPTGRRILSNRVRTAFHCEHVARRSTTGSSFSANLSPADECPYNPP